MRGHVVSDLDVCMELFLLVLRESVPELQQVLLAVTLQFSPQRFHVHLDLLVLQCNTGQAMRKSVRERTAASVPGPDSAGPPSMLPFYPDLGLLVQQNIQ